MALEEEINNWGGLRLGILEQMDDVLQRLQDLNTMLFDFL